MNTKAKNLRPFDSARSQVCFWAFRSMTAGAGVNVDVREGAHYLRLRDKA